jgi:glycerate dehydrogenase
MPAADVAFIFGENNNCDYSNLRMIYYGVSQPDIRNNIKSVQYFASGLSSKAIAEYCLTYSLLLLNNVREYIIKQDNKIWRQAKIPVYDEITLKNKCIGVLGLGNNGRCIAEIFRKQGCKVFGYDIDSNYSAVVDVFCKSKDELFSNSDILVVAVNSYKENLNLINRESIKLMKSSAYLINISRGNIINEKDLYYALKNKIISGAVLDVTVDEPLSKYSKLWNLDNIIITPHISGNVNMFVKEIMSDFSNKLYEYLNTGNV